MEWAIRAYRSGDERELANLFERVFGRLITEDHWRWKLKQLPTPVENVWLAVHEDKPIFQYAGIPLRVRLPSGEARVMVSVDTMTAPEFQRQGLLSQVGRWTYDSWREGGVAFVIGLPNERWGSRAAALGWQELFPLQWLVRPLRPEALISRRLPSALNAPGLLRYSPLGALWSSFWNFSLPQDPAVQVRQVLQASEAFDRLWQNCQSEFPISNVRDSSWVHWRYLAPPTLHYGVVLAERAREPVGYAAYRLEEQSGRQVGSIAEVFAARADVSAQSTLFGCVLRKLYAAGAEQAVTLAIPGTPLWRTLRRAGFFPRAIFSVQIVPLDPGLPMEALCDPLNWGLSGGDFDVI